MAFRKVTNAILLAVTATILFSTIGLNAMDRMGFELPRKLELVQSRSWLEGNTYGTNLPELTVESYLRKEFQESADTWFSVHVPARDSAVLAYASLQGSAIRIANLSIGFELYPTFYGSDMNAMPGERMIVQNVVIPNEEMAETAREFAELVNELALKHPDVNFVYDSLQPLNESEFNPTCKYRPNTFTEEWYEKNVFEALTAPNITGIYDPIQSFEEFKSQWFVTDHHWTLERALRTYNSIAEELDLESVIYDDPLLVAESWYGSLSRRGRTLEYTSSFYDLPTDFSQLEWFKLDGAPAKYGAREMFMEGEELTGKDYQFFLYDRYHGELNVRAINHGNNNGKKCLVVGVSFTRCLKGYIAANYAETVFLDPANHVIDKPLSEYLDEGYDDVIVLLRGTSYFTIKESSPEFVE